MSDQPITIPEEDIESAKKAATIVYGLQAASFLVAVTFIAAIVVNYVKKDDVADTWVASHFRWQIRTFWFALLWCFIGFVTLMLGIGGLILVATAVWVIYRIAKGWLSLSDNKAMYLDD